jgi:hypothetical protein
MGADWSPFRAGFVLLVGTAMGIEGLGLVLAFCGFGAYDFFGHDSSPWLGMHLGAGGTSGQA